ncbi:hypothetical protein BZA70DRAFT_5708 [Myxozyma melibiosi]|uniref:Uncharacterized protein n=1 Tax=Myxozyma melibiosi TaxID=54550 RepID=A0ABR1FBE3_9ASCO
MPHTDVGCSSTSSELVRSFKSFALASLALGDCDDDIFDRKTSLAGVDKDHRDDSSTKTKQAWEWDLLPPLPEFEPIDLDNAANKDSTEVELTHRSNISRVSSKSTLPTPPIAYHEDAENITPRTATRTKALTVRRQLNTNFAPVREDYNSTYGQMRLQEQTADQTEYRSLLADGALLLQSSDLSTSVLNNWYEVTAELNRRLGSDEEPLLHPLRENTATPASAWTIDSEEFEDAGEGLTEDEDFVQFWLDNRLNEEGREPDTLTPLASSSSEDTFSKRRLNRSSGTKETSIVPAMSTMTAKMANRSQTASSDGNDDSALRITLASDPASTTALAPASTVRPQLRHVTPIRNGDENDSVDECDSLTFFPTVSNAPVDYDLESARSHRKWWGRLPTRTQYRSRVPFTSKRSHTAKSTLGNVSPSNPGMTAHQAKTSTRKVLSSSEDYRRRYAATRARIRAERDERRNQSRFASLLRRMSLRTN